MPQTSYRSAIFYTSDEQKRIAEKTIADVDASGLWPGKAVRKWLRRATFGRPNPNIRIYLERYPNGYTCHYVRPNWEVARRLPRIFCSKTTETSLAEQQAQ